jgi:hypothetical protein
VLGFDPLIEDGFYGFFIGSVNTMRDLSLLFGLTVLTMIVCEILIGFLFLLLLGAWIVLKWVREGSASQKLVRLQQKLATVQVPLGFAALATTAILLLYWFRILEPDLLRF